MTIYIIEKQPSAESKKPTISSVLTKDEEDSFINYFVDKDNLLPYNKKHITRIAADIHTKDQWLMCGCQKDTPPIFRLNKSVRGNLFIRNLTKRGPHHSNCSLRFEILESSNKKKEYKPNKIKLGPLNLVDSFAKGISKPKMSKKRSATQSYTSRRGKLANTLFRMIEESGANIIDQSNTSPVWNRFMKNIASYEVCKGVSLKKYFITSQFINNNFAPINILKNDKIEWPKNTPKYSLMLATVKERRGNILVCINKQKKEILVEIKDKISVSSGRFGERTGPYMALILYSALPSSPYFFEARKAFIIPRYSDTNLIPVDSYYEREVLKGLYHLQIRCADKGVYFVIEKPVFDKHVVIEGEEHSALPDFVISYQGRKLILEVNGSHEEEYLERKERTHRIMSYMGEVLSFDALKFDKDEKTLKTAINDLMIQVEKFL